jgi:ribosomal protein S12 methylthiotransferase
LLQFVQDFGFDMMGVFPYSQESGTSMGRMDGQLPDSLKQQRVEELMLAQQQVAFAKGKAMIGSTISVLIDSLGVPASAGMCTYVARSRSQAPEIDSVVHLTGRNLHPGQLLDVRVTDYQAYDLIADVPVSRARKLAVLAH